ncbi:integrin alpha [Streptomyces scopuliridis]|uniref:integrin alpha n=1 Tax=Streptomyces scopuliridis TaxID=452529 RepID=UPI0036A256A8
MRWASGADGLTRARELRGGPVAASGDLNGDGYDDLVTGEPKSPDDGGDTLTGAVIGVYYGSEEGPAGAEGPGSPPAVLDPGLARRGRSRRVRRRLGHGSLTR